MKRLARIGQCPNGSQEGIAEPKATVNIHKHSISYCGVVQKVQILAGNAALHCRGKARDLLPIR